MQYARHENFSTFSRSCLCLCSRSLTWQVLTNLCPERVVTQPGRVRVKRRTSEDLVLDKSFKHSGGFNRQEQLKRRHSEPDVLSTVLAERISQKESLQQGGSGQNMQASSVHNGSCAAASAGTSADAPPVFRDSFARSKAAAEELAASGALEA